MTSDQPARQTSVWQSSEVNAAGVRLQIRRQTAPGTPLLLLHGLGASGAVWQAFARRLNPPYQCIAPDLRGHGDSDKPPTGYEPTDYAADIGALIAALGPDPIRLIGHSLGALVTIALAAHHADSISAAILLDPPLDPTIHTSDVPEVYRLRKAPPGELERYLSVPALAPIFRQAADAAFESYLNTPRGAKWAWNLAPTIQTPTLLIQADPTHGGALGDQAAADFIARLPNAHHVKVEGAAHALHATHGAEAAKLVLAFLAEHAA